MKPAQNVRRPVLRRHRFLFASCFVLPLGLLVAVAALPGSARGEEEAAAIERRLADAARYLSSDELEGRGVGTKGLDLAADYLAEQFSQIGLETALFDGSPMQPFELITSAESGSDNRLTLIGPPGENGEPETIALEPDNDFSAMAASGNGEFDLPLVFVGYGITGKAEGYDDYAGIDVKGKAVVILRHEPQQSNPQSVFAGTKNSAHAPFRAKLANAFDHGAAGVIFCTDQFEVRKNVGQHRRKWQQALDRLAAEHAKFKRVANPTLRQIEDQRRRIDELMGQVEECGEQLAAQCDPVLPFRPSRDAEPRPNRPVLHCRRGALDRIVTATLAVSLAGLEERIDYGPTPHSRELTGWRAVGNADVTRKTVPVKNVVGLLPGEGPLAEQTIVVGAHYDHVGFSGEEANRETIRNGADDNASGVAVMLEIARSLVAREEKLRRSVLFIAFTAEERGLCGSAHYVNVPIRPLENTVAMLNLDMVGRLRDDQLSVFGTGTAGRFDALLDQRNEHVGLRLTKKPSGFGPSDHASFYSKKIPVMHFFTGMHKDAHRPGDDFEKLNVPGMRRVGRLVSEVLVALADAEERPQYVSTGATAPRGSGGKRPYLGTVPDFAAKGPGYALAAVTEDGPAARAGLQAGDAIIEFDGGKIGSLEDIDGALRKRKAGDKVSVVVRRGQEMKTFEVTLGDPR